MAAVKPRVDTHWKKPIAISKATNAKGPTAGRTTTTTVGNVVTTTTVGNVGGAGRANVANQASKIARPVVLRAVAEQRVKAIELKDAKSKGN